MAKTQSRRTSVLFRLVLIFSVPAAALLAEGIARLVIADKPEYAMERSVVSSALGMLSPCRDRIGDPKRKEGLKRVVVIGESSGEQLGGDLQSLATTSNPPTMEVLNCAMSGMTIEQVERRFDEALTFEPDAIVLVFGHNVRFVEPTDERALRLTYLRSRSRLLTAVAEWRSGSISIPKSTHSGELTERLARYETFLTRVADETKRRNIRLVATTMASNLMSPPTMMPNAETDALLNARFLEASGKLNEAIDSLQSRVELEQDAAVQFELGHLLRHAHRQREAISFLTRAIETEVDPGRAPDQLNNTIRSLAASRGFALRDTARALRADTPDGIVGWPTHTDHCHLRPRVMHGEALAIADLVNAPDVRTSQDIRAFPVRPEEFAELLPRRLAAVEYTLGHPEAPVEQQYRSFALLTEESVRDHGDAAVEAARTFITTNLKTSTPAVRGRVAAELAYGTTAAGKPTLALGLLDAADAADDAAIKTARTLVTLAVGQHAAEARLPQAKNKE